jgi:hypothetical protein
MATINYRGFRNNMYTLDLGQVNKNPPPPSASKLMDDVWTEKGCNLDLVTMVVSYDPSLHMHLYPSSSHHVPVMFRN